MYSDAAPGQTLPESRQSEDGSTTEDSDFVVGLVGGRCGPDVYLVDRAKDRWGFSETIRQVQALRQKHPRASRILIEDAANGPAIIEVLGRSLSGVTAVKPEGGKRARAQAVQPYVEAGNVCLPNPRLNGQLLPERAWVDDFVHQLTVFPRGAHDDDVDAFTQLVLRLMEPPVRLVW